MSPSSTLELVKSIHHDLETVTTSEDKQNIRKKYFISAEGAYSTLVFSQPNIRILIAGRMFDDKNMKPVIFMVFFFTQLHIIHIIYIIHII